MLFSTALHDNFGEGKSCQGNVQGVPGQCVKVAGAMDKGCQGQCGDT